MAVLSCIPAIASAAPGPNDYCLQDTATPALPAVPCPTGSGGFAVDHIFNALSAAISWFNTSGVAGSTLQVEPSTSAYTGPVHLTDKASLTIFGDPAAPRPVISYAGTGYSTVTADYQSSVTLKHLEIDNTYTAGTNTYVAVSSSSGDIELDDLVLGSTGQIARLDGDKTVTVNRVTARVIPGGTAPAQAIAFDITGQSNTNEPTVKINGLTIDAASQPEGLQLQNVAGATIDGANITAQAAAPTGGVSAGLASLASDTTTIPRITVSHASIAGGSYGIEAFGGSVGISDSLLTSAGPSATDDYSGKVGAGTAALFALTLPGYPAGVRNVTAIATGGGSAALETEGAFVVSGITGTIPPGVINVTNSILRAPAAPDVLGLPATTGVSSDPSGIINISYSNYRSLAGDGSVPGAAIQSQDPLFVNGIPGTGQDFHLRNGSLAVDAGTTVPIGDVDLDGTTRPDGAGTAADLGAYESAFPTPVPPVCQSVTASTAESHAVPISLNCSISLGIPDTYSIVGDPAHGVLSGLNAATGTVNYTPGAGYVGPDSFTYRATNAAGQSNTELVTITVTAVTPFPPTDVTPTVAKAGELYSTWTEGNQLATFARKHKPPVGTKFSFTLNETARVTFAFTQQAAGRKLRGKCVAATKKHRKPACKRMLIRGTLAFTGHSGTNTVSFQGRISRTSKLKPGRYTLVITATNAAGQTSKAQRLSFTIVK